MDARISGMYLAEADTYLGKYGRDVAITAAVVAVVLGAMLRTSYSAVFAQAKANWEQNKCDPIYMPFAGVIMPIPGQSAARTTIQNFDYCVQKDFSIFFGILLLPLEYTAFLILTTIDLLISGVVLAMALVAKLKALISGNTTELYGKLAEITIPIILIVAKMRDAMARSSAALLTMVHTTLTVREMVVSGMLSILTITLDLLIAMSAIIVAMFVVGLVLMMTPAFPVGMAMYVIASTAVIGVVIPTIVIYALLRVFVQETFGKSAAKPPKAPAVPKMPKPKFGKFFKNIFKKKKKK